MQAPYCSLTKKTGTYTFTSQSNSTTFIFRTSDGMGDYIAANPVDYRVSVPPISGSRRPCLGGGHIIQNFVQSNLDRDITFSQYVTGAEMDDLIAAKAQMCQWTWADYLGDSYTVTFDHTEGIILDNKLKANDKYLLRFKFWVDA